jgi:hypothetical protein
MGMAIHTSPGMGVHVSPGKGKVKDDVIAELSRNSFEHIKIDAVGLGANETEVRGLFNGFDVDKVRDLLWIMLRFA